MGRTARARPDLQEHPEKNSSAAKRHVGIREFTVLDVDENYEPPEKPHLRVALIGDVVALHIETREYDAKTKATTSKEVASIVVDIEPFWHGLAASLASEGRKSQ